ncbi:hypothetical protein [Psychrobium sp. 1_MG-2023]|uniref:hypothetical protein n=1 Tax=Psychrobium sp. 1_MG-2023 TaxID=3062624 RepID=UPI000C31F496|nr:hypothetical protein [Psychrobium sp. 1_MG-2023]MDP2562847.1 hypothetical protein [Psychrobium sp. 1_MG-2023]PKF54286.1 hypothetical protein CW748_16280 [Alteromonadales bacterium alter-6D02]
MNYSKTILVVTLLSITSCGGGGSDESATAQPTISQTPSTQPTEPQVTTTPTNSAQGATKTTDLIIEPGFSLTSDVELQIDVFLPDLNERAYLNVCPAPPQGINVNFESCLLRTPLNNGVFKQTILLSQPQVKLVAQVWLYTQASPFKEYEWQYTSGELQPTFSLR